MSGILKSGSIIIALLFLIQSGLHAAGTNKASKPVLSEVPHLQNLLRQEMRAVQQAMGKIVTALPQGEWMTVATTAQAINDSFILQQKLTTQDREKLHQHLPAGFIQLDKTFHQQALKLHDAAAQQDAELSVFYVSKMLNMCVQCHQQYAPQRFPKLKPSVSDAHHH